METRMWGRGDVHRDGMERNAGKGNREREREVRDEILEVGMKDGSSYTASSST